MKIDLGTFYIALSVEDIQKSFDFYANLDFEVIPNGGSIKDKWMVLKNGQTKIGLFEGMFPRNTLTFNPSNARGLHDQLTQRGMELHSAGNIDKPSGPCYFMMSDPDGNPILIDQHDH